MKPLHLLCIALLLAALPASAQDAACTIAAPQFTSASPNIFNDKQEQDLGDALAELQEPELKLLPESQSAELAQIGQQLLAELPATETHFQFRIYESSEINAFSTTGGRIYVSRKLITAITNEDELAGVIGHELGHIYAHHIAIAVTHALRLRLGITQVGDRADIFAKIHQLYNTPPSKTEIGEDMKADANEVKDELLADRIAFYAMSRAGYNPEDFGTFLNQITLNNGKTGNWLTDKLRLTSDDSLRYRANLKTMAALPKECRHQRSHSEETFLDWQKAVIENIHIAAGVVNGDRPLTLDSPLRPDLWRIRFSQDGHYVLAQDENSITIVDRNAAKVLFRIDAPDAEEANFSRDSNSVVFHTSTLRIEKWSIATGKRTYLKEMTVLNGCDQALLSYDGDTLICAQPLVKGNAPFIDMKILDVDSGTLLWEDLESLYFGSSAYFHILGFGPELLLSPDGRYVVMAAGSQAEVFDLTQRIPAKLTGKLNELIGQTRTMAFVGPDKLLAATNDPVGKGVFKANVLSFSSATIVEQTQIIRNIEGVTKGNLLITRPTQDHAAGILDYEHGNIIGFSKFPAIDLYDHFAASETGAGELALGDISDTKPTHIKLPPGQLPELQYGEFSSDGHYLAISLRSRSEIWDLETNKGMPIPRFFRSVWIDGQDHIFAQFPKTPTSDQKESEITMTPLSAKDLGKYDDQDLQYHDLQVRFIPDGNWESLASRATLQVKKAETGTVLWSRDYLNETPTLWGAEDGRIVLTWNLSNKAVQAEAKFYPSLQKQLDSLKDSKKALLLETVEADTGKPLQQVAIPETNLDHSWSDIRHAWVSGNYALVHGEHGENDTTTIYALNDGTKVGEFFGFLIATDAADGLIAASNREGEVILLDEHNGKELQRFMLGSAVRLASFVNGKEKELMVLTADQIVHRLPLPKQDASSQSASAAK